MKVNREDFLRNLNAIQPGLDTKEVIEQATCFVFTGGFVVTYNDEVSCRIPSGLDAKFKGAVQAKSFLDILGKLPEDMIELEGRDGELHIVGKGRRVGVRLEKEIHLPVGNVESPGEWQELHQDFPDAIKIVQECAGEDETQFSLTCVHITPKWVEACDRVKLARYKIATGLENPVLVKRDALKHITALGMTHFSETHAWIHFKNAEGLIYSCRRYTDVSDFPELGSHLKVEGTSTVLPKGLKEAAERAEVFSQENIDSNKILVEIRPGKLRLKGQGLTGWFSEVKNIQYSGSPLAFLISPSLLAAIATQHNSCLISETRLRVDGDRWRFVACLGKVNKEDKE